MSNSLRKTTRGRWLALAMLGAMGGAGASAGCQIVIGIGPWVVEDGAGGSGGSPDTGGTTTSETCTEAERPCYSGPDGTEGVGLCKAGKQVCDAGGSMYGPCMEEVTPVEEDCFNDVDEDCDGYVCSQTLWVRQFPNLHIRAVTANRTTGETYLAGDFDGAASFGSDELTAAGGTDIFVAKLDGEGIPVWARAVGGQTPEAVLGIEVWNETVTVLGTSTGNLTLDGKEIATGLVVLRFDDDGELQWVANGAGDVKGRLAIDRGTGDALVGGRFASLTWGVAPMTTGGDYDLFVTRLGAADGEHMNTKFWTEDSEQTVNSLAVDEQGSIFVSGDTSVEIQIGGTTIDPGLYLMKLASNMAELWIEALGPGASPSVFVGPGDAVSIAASCNGMENKFGGAPLPAVGTGDLCVARMNGVDGSQVWARRFGVTQSTSQLRSLSVDSKGNLGLVGLTSGALVLDGKVVATKTFAASFRSGDGELRWLRSIDSLSASVVTYSAHDVLTVSGTFSGTLDLGTGDLTAQSAADGFVATIAP